MMPDGHLTQEIMQIEANDDIQDDDMSTPINAADTQDEENI